MILLMTLDGWNYLDVRSFNKVIPSPSLVRFLSCHSDAVTRNPK